MKALFFVLFYFSTTSVLYAQTDHYSIDTTANSGSKLLPFDRPFLLDFRGSNSQSIFGGVIFKWRTSGSRKGLRQKNNMLQYQTIRAEDVFPAKKGVDIYVRGQSPNSNLALMLAHHFDNTLMEDILQVNFLLKNGKRLQADSILASLSQKVDDRIIPLPGIPLDQLKAPSFFAAAWIQDKNIVVENTIEEDTVTDVNATVIKGYNEFYSKNLDAIYRRLNGINSPDQTIDLEVVRAVTSIADSLQVKNTTLNALFSVIIHNKLDYALSGQIEIREDFAFSTVKESNLPGRVLNLQKSAAMLEKMMYANDFLIARFDSKEVIEFNKGLKALHKDIEVNGEKLSAIYKEIKAQVYSNPNLTYSSWAMAGNEVWDLKTAGSYHVIPDIGIVTIYATGIMRNEVIVRPYLGASIYVRPVDKNVPYKYFERKYRWLHRFSFNLGITVGNNDQGEFSSFFNSMNLLVGANYKLIRPISISGGVSLMKRTNVNPAIEAKETVANPYVALSFDLDFMNAIQKLTGNFIK